MALCNSRTTSYIPEGGGDVMLKPAYIYLVIPDLVAMREPEVVGVSPLKLNILQKHLLTPQKLQEQKPLNTKAN
ncbi:hypothetical protein [Mannheimia haemolytica]